jgi:hypothetical protein
MRRHCIIAFSLANFCFFNAWREVLSPEGLSYLYYWKQYPGYAALAALAINVLLLASIFAAGVCLLRRAGGVTGERASQIIFLLVFLRTVNNIRAQFEFLSTSHIHLVIGRAGYIAAMLLVFLLIIFAIRRYGLRRVARGFALVLLIWSPFGLLGFAQASWWALKYGRATARERTPAPALEFNSNQRPRVVWLIFDELDEHLAFAARPTGLSLPELDRLRADSLFATNAFPPAGHTSQSIPALLTGQLIAAVKPIEPGELQLTIPSDGRSVPWTVQPDIFTAARASGFNSALVGWYHPYCRVIADRLTSCHWEPASQRIDPSKLSLTSNLIRQDNDLLRLLPFSARLRERLSAKRRDYVAEHLADYLTLMSHAENVVADQNFGLVFVHLPAPHPPGIYDRAGRNFSSQETSYPDNLALADRALGELRKKMEQAGVWDRSAVIVSSDHWWRADYWRGRIFWSQADQAVAGAQVDHRIPFMVKLAGQTTASQYDAAFNTVLTHDLILKILRGGISDQKDLAGWLDKHRTIGESPYQSYEDE